ncbi:MAG TPA: hypothetical protein DEG71_03600 [Clostridiales bacterium]|nr:hypothetical protein [Clostridiales bacterium]
MIYVLEYSYNYKGKAKIWLYKQLFYDEITMFAHYDRAVERYSMYDNFKIKKREYNEDNQRGNE